jgi:hypothetical protein
MASVVDDDVAQAVLAKWNADTTLALIPIARGRLTATVTSQTVYAGLEVAEGDKPDEYSTGGVYVSYQTVTITLRGLEANVRAALAQVHAVFDPVKDGSNVLVIPNGTFMVCWPLGRHVEQDPATKDNTDIWQGVARYRMESIRAWPGN